jgi:hypothetical protein
MRFMALLKATADTEAGVQPSEAMIGEMMKFNAAMVEAGVLRAGEGLHPSSKGARVRFSGDRRTVIDGPFTETKDLIAGFWLIEVASKDEAIEWIKRCPHPHEDEGEAEIELRQLFGPEDFENATPEQLAQEDALRAASEARSR